MREADPAPSEPSRAMCLESAKGQARNGDATFKKMAAKDTKCARKEKRGSQYRELY